MLALGVLFFIIGLLIWKKEKIELIHSYHYEKVSGENVKAYTALMGKGMIVISAGMILTGLINYLAHTERGWIIFGIGFATGIVLMVNAGRKYNR